MDFSSANSSLWNGIVQFGIIAGSIIVANILRRKIGIVRKSMMPTAVLAGFLLLLLQNVGVLKLDMTFLESITYHGIAIGFIALSLRVNKKTDQQKADLVAPKSGALIVSTYLIQGITGIAITLALAHTVKPGLFEASGILLPMGYGQGPGQANNVGGTYEALGFAGGRSFALSIAAAGYLCACIIGVIYINVIAKKGKVKMAASDDAILSVEKDQFEDEGEIPVSHSIDKLSIQFSLILFVYLLTYLACYGITQLVSAKAPGLYSTIIPLLWGFNFIVGSVIAMATRSVIGKMREVKIMHRQYQNNYLLSRISGLAFDIMIVGGIASIDIADLSGLWVPFILLAVAGGVVTFLYLQKLCRRLYPDYPEESFVSMYGMLTGTISSGVLLLRELDPSFKTPASNNLLTGSSFAIVFGAPMLLLISIAPRSTQHALLALGLFVIYFIALLLFIYKVHRRNKGKNSEK